MVEAPGVDGPRCASAELERRAALVLARCRARGCRIAPPDVRPVEGSADPYLVSPARAALLAHGAPWELAALGGRDVANAEAHAKAAGLPSGAAWLGLVRSASHDPPFARNWHGLLVEPWVRVFEPEVRDPRPGELEDFLLGWSLGRLLGALARDLFPGFVRPEARDEAWARDALARAEARGVAVGPLYAQGGPPPALDYTGRPQPRPHTSPNALVVHLAGGAPLPHLTYSSPAGLAFAVDRIGPLALGLEPPDLAERLGVNDGGYGDAAEGFDFGRHVADGDLPDDRAAFDRYAAGFRRGRVLRRLGEALADGAGMEVRRRAYLIANPDDLEEPD